MPELRDRALALLPAAATATAEGAWLIVVYASVQLGLTRQPAAIDIWAFVVAAAIGIVIVRRVPAKRVAITTLATAVVLAVLGWVTDPLARGALVEGSLGTAAAHPAGLLLGFGVWRGSRHADPKRGDEDIGSLLRWGMTGLAVPWLLGTASELRAEFVALALPATLLFAAAGLVAIGLTRLEALAAEAGIDWRRNRSWLWLLIAVVALVVAVGSPVALLLGASLSAILSLIPGPILALLGVVADAAAHVGQWAASLVPPSTSPGSSVPPSSPPTAPAIPIWLADVIWIGVAVALGVALFVVWRRVRGTPAAVKWRPPKAEERHIELPRPRFRLPPIHLPSLSLRRARRPTTATAAYVTLLREFADQPLLARGAGESPRSHAGRLRRQGQGSLAVDLLAADYVLERYADRTLTANETRRAIGRWHRSRRVA